MGKIIDLNDIKNTVVNKFCTSNIQLFETSENVLVNHNSTIGAGKLKIGVCNLYELLGRGLNWYGGFGQFDNLNVQLYYQIEDKCFYLPLKSRGVTCLPECKTIVHGDCVITFISMYDYFEAAIYLNLAQKGINSINDFLAEQAQRYKAYVSQDSYDIQYAYNRILLKNPSYRKSLTDEDLLKYAEAREKSDIKDNILELYGGEDAKINIAEMSLIKALLLVMLININSPRSTDMLYEIYLGLHNGLSEEAVGAYILEETAEDMRKIRLELEAQLSDDDNQESEDEERDILTTSTIDSIYEKLDKLIGLDVIKKEVRELTNIVQMQAKRKEMNLPYVPFSLHMVFTGNPGTGKTTIARIIAELYREIGILSKGHLVEVDRSGLIGQYVGHTEEKTQEVINSAMGGVLFIDEAYTLVKEDSSSDFGQNAIDVLLKAMEDNRDDFVVIVAGYEEPMKAFINSNQGLKSRFNKYIEFPDYNLDEMMEIFDSICKGYQYSITDGARALLVETLSNMIDNKDESFANGRDVRNLFEKVVARLASRVAVTGEDITVIVEEDFAGI